MLQYLTQLQNKLEKLNELVGKNRYGQGNKDREELLEEIQCRIDEIVIEIGEYKKAK